MKKGMKKSDVVTQFIQLTDVARQISIVASDEVHKQDLLTNDFLHQLELGSAKERNKRYRHCLTGWIAIRRL